MKFFEKLSAFAEKVRLESTSIESSEAPKSRLVIPFIKTVLGYGTENPDEIAADYACQTATGKTEKVDYVIFRDEAVYGLVKQVPEGTRLGAVQKSALARIHNASGAQFSVLTDGQVYQFFADLKIPGRMDRTPFLIVDLLKIDAIAVSKLKRLTKSTYRSIPTTVSSEEQSYIQQISNELKTRLSKPEEDFMKNFCRAGL